MSEDKSIFGKIGNMFVRDVEDDPVPTNLPPVASAPSAGFSPPVTPLPPSAMALDPEKAKQLDAAASAQLSSSVEKASGSYAEFLANMEVLAEAVPDEGQRLRAAVKMLGKKGVTIARLLNDVDACLGALEEENRTFKLATQDQIDQKVGSKRKAVEQLKASMDAKQAQISALQAEIAALNGQRSTAAADIKAEEDNITVVQDRFSFVFTNMRASLTAQRARIAAQGT
jgi:chromosome segregation ATPase